MCNLLCYQDDSFSVYQPTGAIDCNLFLPSSISEPSAISFRISPNPTADFLNIETDEREVLQAEIFDLSGRKLLATKVNDKIDVRALSPAVYLVKLTSAQSSGTKLWVKE